MSSQEVPRPRDWPQKFRAKSSRSIIWAGVLCLLLIFVGAIVLVINPFDWFLKRSDNFTIDKFLAIQAGTDVSAVFEALGDPIRVSTDVPRFVGCPDCSALCFLGEPPEWLIGHREAWVLVDKNGIVVARTLVDEP